MNRRKKSRHKKKNPVKKYLETTDPDTIPYALKRTLMKKEPINNVHLVDIYGETQGKPRKKAVKEFRTHSETLAKRSKMML